MANNLQERWNRCCEFIRDNVGVDRFNIWFAKAKPLELRGSNLILELPSSYFIEKYEDEFYDVITSAVKKEFGADIRLFYDAAVVQDDPEGHITVASPNQSRVVNSRVDRAAVQQTVAQRQQAPADNFDHQLNPRLNFENYIVGESNKLPHAIATSIAENPRNANFNPYFLYGDVGVGKTHLIQSIGIRIKEKFPRAKVLFTTARQFQNLYAHAVMSKDVPNFLNWFMQMDVLLFDDLQEIAHKVKTSDEALFPIFNHLHQNGRQLIFTCDRPPMELDGIADRLIDRFRWGITERLDRPDADLRRKILNFKARKNGLDLSDEVIDLIAETATTSVRELEGIVMGIYTRAINSNAPITTELAREVMKNSVKITPVKPLNFDMIVEATADFFNLNSDVIFTKSRVRDIADARQVVMYLSHKLTGLSSPAIGAKLNRSHATVLHGIANVRERLSVSHELANAIESIEAELH